VNLANNAIKFTQRGEVIIRVTLAGRTAEQSALKFSVQDTGIGIPADRRDRLFKSFSQVDASMSRKYGGTGLGLAIARQLVELMGGQIGCDSVPGEGSTFHFTVTLAQASPSSAPAAAPRLDLRGLRVLVVDDNATYRDILANQLLSWGFDVALAEDAEVALRELVAAQQQHKPFRIAIVDMILPGKSGPELAAIVRQDSGLARTAMIMVTSADSGFDPGGMREIGFSACLTKPIRQSHLFDAIVESMTPASRSSEQTEAPRVREAVGNRARILLAEDNTVNQMVASELLKDAGYLCDIVADGRGAVEAAAHDAYAIILMDCQMPEMNGFDATREIRASEARNGKMRVPIIALTANAVQGDRERCLETGMDDYVTKPIDPDQLLKTIERHLAEQSPHVIGASKPAPEAQTTAGSATIPTSASSGMPPVDTSSLLRRCRGKASLVEQLLQKFESQALEQLRSLEEAASRNDREAIARISHAVKGAAANLSAESVRASAMTLEGSAAALGEDELLRGIERLAASVRECVAYIPSACVELEKLAAAGASEVK
jgi:Amt family ammonium transporter